MPLRSRKSPAAPSELLDNLRVAQAQHAQDVAAANEKLIDTHNDVFVEVTDRKSVISEQIALLNAEHDGLTKVEAEATAISV